VFVTSIHSLKLLKSPSKKYY